MERAEKLREEAERHDGKEGGEVAKAYMEAQKKKDKKKKKDSGNGGTLSFIRRIGHAINVTGGVGQLEMWRKS